MELLNGYFPDCFILIPKQQKKKKKSGSKNDILLNHEAGRGHKDYLVIPSTPNTHTSHPLRQITQSSGKSLSRAIPTYPKAWPLCLVPHYPELPHDTLKSPYLELYICKAVCSHTLMYTISAPWVSNYPATCSISPVHQPCPPQMSQATPGSHLPYSFLPLNIPILIQLRNACPAPIHNFRGPMEKI